jgi:integrase
MTQHLTDAVVKRLPTPDRDNRVYYDSDQPGFGVRVTRRGHRSFILNYIVKTTGRERRLTVGSFPAWSVVGARQEARRLRREIEAGGDPMAAIEASRAAPTVGDLIERFEAEHLPRLRSSSRQKYREQIRKYVRPILGTHTKISEIGFADIDRMHRRVTEVGGPYAANRTHSVVTKMFSMAIRWSWVTVNPAKGVEHNPEVKRKRYLSADELARLIQALAEHPNQQSANIIRILMMTGARKSEVLGMRWDQLDLSTGIWTKLASATKQKADHTVPLSAPVRMLLNELYAACIKPGEFVFANARKDGPRLNIQTNWEKLCKAAGIEGLRIHDLRHSFASQLASGGASLPLIGALLGHSNPNTTARYAHLFLDPLRAATERVGATIDAAGKPVVEPIPIKRGG